ncbi:hypothetical protein PFMG_01262 [Plasmodium falciparum IGH-CR14]|uniref:Uncharacterized protein n=1 Tax=Plasmodium falciparum IGH-CR14 TaxID=580059 RepID=A0A0L1I6G8_PLAFA|nr:hypothetical protein PFMG_01262 [Plasmodium falciparum IGH-CR14]
MNLFSPVIFPLLIFLLSYNGSYANYNIKTIKLIFESRDKESSKVISLYGEKDSFVCRSENNEYIRIQDDKTIINNLNIYGIIHTNDLLYFEKEQWKLYYMETFDEYSTCGNSPDTFLGGPCKFAATEAYNKIKNLPKHKELKIKLRIHFFDLWEDDSLFLQVDNKTIWTHSHRSCVSKLPVDMEFLHTSDTLNILVGSTLKKNTNPCETSWGIDDLIIYYK